MPELDAIFVGGGFFGCALAAHLRERGQEVLVVERADRPAHARQLSQPGARPQRLPLPAPPADGAALPRELPALPRRVRRLHARRLREVLRRRDERLEGDRRPVPPVLRAHRGAARRARRRPCGACSIPTWSRTSSPSARSRSTRSGCASAWPSGSATLGVPVLLNTEAVAVAQAPGGGLRAGRRVRREPRDPARPRGLQLHLRAPEQAARRLPACAPLPAQARGDRDAARRAAAGAPRARRSRSCAGRSSR